jgi:SAM-dependent methyltransferase
MISKNHSVFPWLKAKIEIIAKKDFVLDLGTPQRFAKELSFFEDLFGDNYRALGYKPEGKGRYTCDYDGDILNLQFGDNSIDAIICLSVLEHVADPFRAIIEIYRVLKPNGIFLLSAPFLTSYHGKKMDTDFDPSHGGYPDFWRFTHQGLQLLLKGFRSVEIVPVGGPLDFRLSVFYVHNTAVYRSRFVQRLIDAFDKIQLGKATIVHFAFAVK